MKLILLLCLNFWVFDTRAQKLPDSPTEKTPDKKLDSKKLDDKKAEDTEASISAPPFDAERWKALMGLVDSEIKTIKGNKYSGAELKHRLFELYSEKIKLIKEKENYNLLKADIKEVQKNGKESFFKASSNQYKIAQTYAISIISQHPNYQKISEIYYALAINSRDYGTSEETEKFLKLAISKSSADSKTFYNAKTSLAEYYYNNKKYSDALVFYNDVLKNNTDEWYGKHLYNAGWCNLKERNFKRALELMILAFETTKSKKYVSIREQVINAIGLFYVQADETYAGIEFFEKNVNPATQNLLNLALSSMNKNNFSITEDVLKAALKDSKKRKDANAELKVRITQLDVYRESKKDDLYFETANNILELHKKSTLDKDDLFIAQNKIKEVAGFMQINLIKDKTKDPVEYSKDDYKKIMRYFDILASLDKPNKKLYRYYQGETALSAHDYQVALKYYVRSIMNAKLTKDTSETTRKALDALLTTIELAKLSKTKEDEYTIFTFKNFVISYPVSDKSQVIYQKLFNKYFELNKIKKAVNVLLVYTFHYKGDEKIHREMLTQILDSYIKEKNTDKLAFWVGKIEKGYLNFSQEYIQNSIAVLGGLLFNKYQALEKKGMVKEAVKGYESIYDSKQYPKRIKAEAAYAIAALSLEQNKSRESYKWLKRSLDYYDSKELIKVTASLFTLSKGYRLLQKFDISSEIALYASRLFCKEEYANKEDFYQLINENILATNEKIGNLISIEEEFKKCNLNEKLLTRSQKENMERLIYSDRFKDIITYFKAYPTNPSLVKLMEKFMTYRFYQNPEMIAKEHISNSLPININATITQYQSVDAFTKKVQDLKFVFTNEEKFNEDKYNAELEQYFAIVTEINNEAVKLSKLSSPLEIIMIRNVISRPYFSLVKEIRKYEPRGVDARYLEGFKQGMRQITESLLSKGLQLDNEKSTFFEKNNNFFEIQKSDIFGVEKSSPLEKELNFHSAILFSNTLDIGSITTTNNGRLITGQ